MIRCLDSKLTEEERLIRHLTQALKDIINAADGGYPYSDEELKNIFHKDCRDGCSYLAEHGIEEIA